MTLTDIKAFPLSAVTLENCYFVNAYKKEIDYLTSLNPDRLLAGFRETAGLDMKSYTRYPGWEDMLIGGHTIGHYLTACANSYETANAGDGEKAKLLSLIREIITGLKECQEALGTGLIFGAKILDPESIEKQFDNVEKGLSNLITEAWVPWYTLHKIFEGLVTVARLQSEPELAADALLIASRLADWTYARTSSWSEETHRTVLSIEYGGINDILYEVYSLTGKKEHLEAAHAFDQVDLFERILKASSGENALNNHHANTTIPKFVGAMKRYIITGDKIYFDYAEAFWKMVAFNHTYITGDNSEWEHFGEDGILDAERTNCNCETCNAYNMLKLTKLLFMATGDVKYADWYENTFINTILSSQNPATGMTTYFQPMATGYFKVYGERYDKFWCCVGSGMENFSKLGEALYYYNDSALIVNEYFASKLSYDGFDISISTDIPLSEKADFVINSRCNKSIAFRLPDWLDGEATILVNGTVVDPVVFGASAAERDTNCSETLTARGYALVEGPFEAGTVITVILPTKVRAYSLPDGKHTFGFKYGPLVLSALLGDENMLTGKTGVDVTIPAEKLLSTKYLPSGSDTVKVVGNDVDNFIARISDNLVRNSSSGLSFELKNTDSNLTYVPHYSQHTQRYGLYFKFEQA